MPPPPLVAGLPRFHHSCPRGRARPKQTPQAPRGAPSPLGTARAHALRPPGAHPLPGGCGSRGRRASGPLAESLVAEPADRERAGSFVVALGRQSRAPIAGLTVTPAVYRTACHAGGGGASGHPSTSHGAKQARLARAPHRGGEEAQFSGLLKEPGRLDTHLLPPRPPPPFPSLAPPEPRTVLLLCPGPACQQAALCHPPGWPRPGHLLGRAATAAKYPFRR